MFGAVTTVGGVFGPLYRAFDLMRRAIAVKVVALALVLPLGALLLEQAASGQFVRFFGMTAFSAYNPGSANTGALIGAVMIDALYIISVALTVLVTLPELRKRAR